MQKAARCLGAAAITQSRGDSVPGLGSSSGASEMCLDSTNDEVGTKSTSSMRSVSKREASGVRPRVFLETQTEEGWHHPLLKGGHGVVEEGGAGQMWSGHVKRCHLDNRVEVRWGS